MVDCQVVSVEPAHVPALFEMVCELAEYEKLTHLVTGTAHDLEHELFDERPVIEALVALAERAPEPRGMQNRAPEPRGMQNRAPKPRGMQNRAPKPRAVGFALFFHNFSTFLTRRGLYLEDLYVKPAFRRRGYGTALLTRVAAIAHERGCGRLEWSVLDWNQSAIDFYERHGATILPDWRIARVSGDALARLAGR